MWYQQQFNNDDLPEHAELIQSGSVAYRFLMGFLPVLFINCG
jgi:hypothetical protein